MPNAYPMTKKIRGQCLIIDNEKFVNDVLPYREGSMIDSNNLDILYEQLGFKVRLTKRRKRVLFLVHNKISSTKIIHLVNTDNFLLFSGLKTVNGFSSILQY